MTTPDPRPHGPGARIRLDKWLWAARFYKTRGLAAEVIEKGRVQVNGQPAKRSRELHVGDRIGLQPCTRGEAAREVCVRALTDTRGPATVARSLYEETPQSIAAREAATRARPYVADPVLAIEQGRPTKRDRRELVAWQRWGASIDE